MNLLNPKAFIVKKKSINPLNVLAKARPAAPYGLIKIKENTIFQAKLFIDIFALKNCCSFAYNHNEKIFARPKGKSPIKYIVKINAVLELSTLVNAPLSNNSFTINSLKTIPIIIERDKTPNKIKDDFFIKASALFSSLFLIDLAIIGNRAIEVAIAKIASGSWKTLFA